MPFWLCEKRLTGLLRTISIQHQSLITLCCMLAGVICTIIYKQLTQQEIIVIKKQLRQISYVASHEKIEKLARINRSKISLEDIPQTLSFFNSAGFYVQTVEQKSNNRKIKAIGYIVKTRSTFDTLINFLESKQKIPTTQLTLQSISRIDDHVVEIEFFIPKQRL